jgi:hypothetical protein
VVSDSRAIPWRSPELHPGSVPQTPGALVRERSRLPFIEIEVRTLKRYADNDAEFDEYGGNTAAREQFETAQWSASLSAGRVASRSPTVTGSRGFSITDATLNARPALNKQSGKSE